MPEPATLKINEIFWSVQGEGTHGGLPAIFIRLAGCSLKCPYCDTRPAWQQGEEMPPARILAAVRRLRKEYPRSRTVISGGEPLEQELAALVGALNRDKAELAIETNGLYFQDLAIGWWTVSPKDVSGFRIHPRLIPLIDEVKLIANENLSLETVKKIRLLSADFPIFLQPEASAPDRFRRAFELYRSFQHDGIANLHLGFQLHRLYDIP